ncbi:MAG: hypothetical protein MHMPM18_002750 [Marteilia pararefringens]
MGLEYFHSSRAFKFISATSNKITPEGTTLHTDIQKSYAMRAESMQQLSLYEYAREFDFTKKQSNQNVSQYKYTKREKAAVVTTPLRIRTRNEIEYEEYVTNWLLYYSPQPRVHTVDDLCIEQGPNNAFKEKEAKYFQIIEEKYDSRDPEENILKKKFDNANVEEDQEEAEDINDGNSGRNSEEVDILLGRFCAVEEEEITNGAEDTPMVEIVEERFQYINDISAIEKDFRKITGKSINNYEETDQPSFDYIANLNASQLAAFEKAVNPNSRKIILVGKPGTGKYI